MMHRPVLAIILMMALPYMAAHAQRGITSPAAAPVQANDGGFAVIELFTSQGCSSCPPADRLLAEIIAEARKTGQRVYAMAFHVDYWNKLGWKDPYSRFAFTKRQNNYVSALGGSEVYTPQVFVNGSVSMVGSDKKKLVHARDEALASAPAGTLSVTRDSIERDTLFLGYQASLADKNYSLVSALVQRGIETPVPRGENAGKTLTHENVVRIFRIGPLTEQRGTMAIPLNGIRPGRDYSLVAYVQQKQSKHILAATGLAF